MRSNSFALVSLLRPQQWIKNGFVCAGVLFGAQLHNGQLVQSMGLAVIAFCLMGSAVYVLNDYLDRELDKVHPTKRNRPLASGAVTPAQGFFAGSLCLMGSVIAGAISFMPGGLGGSEATMIILLSLSGVPVSIAVSGTVLIRLATLWFAVLLGIIALAIRAKIPMTAASMSSPATVEAAE